MLCLPGYEREIVLDDRAALVGRVAASDPKLPMIAENRRAAKGNRGNVVSGWFVSPIFDGQPALKCTLRLSLPNRL